MKSNDIKENILALNELLSADNSEKKWVDIKRLVFQIAMRINSALNLEKGEVKKVQTAMNREMVDKDPVFLQRPWGHMDIFDETFDTGCMARLITVNPREKLSQQSHDHRNEIYIGITDALVSIGDDPEQPFKPGQTVFIPSGVKHRLSGIQQSTSSRVIEIALYDPQDYANLDAYQNDIHRYTDMYGRPNDGER